MEKLQPGRADFGARSDTGLRKEDIPLWMLKPKCGGTTNSPRCQLVSDAGGC